VASRRVREARRVTPRGAVALRPTLQASLGGATGGGQAIRACQGPQRRGEQDDQVLEKAAEADAPSHGQPPCWSSPLGVPADTDFKARRGASSEPGETLRLGSRRSCAAPRGGNVVSFRDLPVRCPRRRRASRPARGGSALHRSGTRSVRRSSARPRCSVGPRPAIRRR
jgi:hypothetical protein